jgi:hypothetical protein
VWLLLAGKCVVYGSAQPYVPSVTGITEGHANIELVEGLLSMRRARRHGGGTR